MSNVENGVLVNVQISIPSGTDIGKIKAERIAQSVVRNFDSTKSGVDAHVLKLIIIRKTADVIPQMR